MADSAVYRKQGGSELVVDKTGKLTLGNASITINAAGQAVVAGVPSADPHVAGVLWSNSGVLTVSAG
jgi:hypothetical protein